MVSVLVCRLHGSLLHPYNNVGTLRLRLSDSCGSALGDNTSVPTSATANPCIGNVSSFGFLSSIYFLLFSLFPFLTSLTAPSRMICTLLFEEIFAELHHGSTGGFTPQPSGRPACQAPTPGMSVGTLTPTPVCWADLPLCSICTLVNEKGRRCSSTTESHMRKSNLSNSIFAIPAKVMRPEEVSLFHQQRSNVITCANPEWRGQVRNVA